MDVTGHGRQNGDRVRYTRSGVRKRIPESQRHAVQFVPDGKEPCVPEKVIRLACLVFRFFRIRVLAPSEESQGVAYGSVSRFELVPGTRFRPYVRGHDRILQAVGREGNMDRFRNGGKIPQGVKHHHVLFAVILQRVSGLVNRIHRLRIRRPALEDQFPAFGQFRGQYGIPAFRNDLGTGRLRAAVGIIDDIPAVACQLPLGPERQVIRQDKPRARGIGSPAAVLFGIPPCKHPARKPRHRIRDLHFLREERHEGNILRPGRCLTGFGVLEINILLRYIQHKAYSIPITIFRNCQLL